MTQPSGFNLNGINLTYGPNHVMHLTREATGETLIVDPSQMNITDRLTCIEVQQAFNKKTCEEIKESQKELRASILKDKQDYKEMNSRLDELYKKLGRSTISSHPNRENMENNPSLVTKAKNGIYSIYTSIKGFFFVSSNT